jgi:cytochrome b561
MLPVGGHVGCISRRPARGRPPPEAKQGDVEKVHSMLYTIAVVMIILWLLGLVTSTTMGGLIHILLVIAIIMILVNLISGRRSL